MAGNTRRKPEPARRRRPARTPEDRNNELTGLAYELVERKLRDGSASSQETTHFLKMGSDTARLEREKLTNEIALLQARVEDLSSRKDTDTMAREALDAFRGYSGQEPEGYEYG